MESDRSLTPDQARIIYGVSLNTVHRWADAGRFASTPGRRRRTRLTPAELASIGSVIEWRGPSPYYCVPVPEPESADIRGFAAMATYGWGVTASWLRSVQSPWRRPSSSPTTGYLSPLKDVVHKPQGLSPDDDVTVEMTIRLKL